MAATARPTTCATWARPFSCRRPPSGWAHRKGGCQRASPGGPGDRRRSLERSTRFGARKRRTLTMAVNRPNVLFLMTDQQQAGTLDPGSPCQTPNLDRLARQGTRFTNAHTVNAICSPTRASLFTGVYPSQHGMVDCAHAVPDYRARLRTYLEMWSQRLAAHGYRCGYFGKWHVERSENLRHFGFEEYDLEGSGASG
ncbi:MAG: sulfatase-like hydrolase/transferase, partial [Chloroflexi bacterium]|nr:sulfatase-like hydrolase/transferase [Chloroflexota bacterium]